MLENCHALYEHARAIRRSGIVGDQLPARLVNQVDLSCARTQSALDQIQKEALFNVSFLETKYPGLRERLFEAQPVVTRHGVPFDSPVLYGSWLQRLAYLAIKKIKHVAASLENLVKRYNVATQQGFGAELYELHSDFYMLAIEAKYANNFGIPELPRIHAVIEEFIKTVETRRSVEQRTAAVFAEKDTDGSSSSSDDKVEMKDV